MSSNLNRVLGYLVLPVYAVAVIVIFLTMPSWTTDALSVGFLIVLAYALVVIMAGTGGLLFGSRESLAPTEWMRRGGLMEAPSPNPQPDEGRIRAALSTLPEDVPDGVRAEIEAYLAMPDDEEKQLRRDGLIREFYERAGSSKIDFAHRKAYNAIRLALSPWAEEDPGA